MTDSLWLRKEENAIETEHYRGEVFCATVPNGTLITRRNGSILMSGNCERDMEGTVNSDSGAQIRDGIKVINTVGACMESEWPYDPSQFTTKPPQSCYTSGAQHEAVAYQNVVQSLSQLKGALASGFPIVFGFTVYESFESDTVAQTGQMTMPVSTEGCLGGHAVLAVGYDDSTQNFIVRNSWGSNWALSGYFMMPYAYMTSSDLASDFWTVRLVK